MASEETVTVVRTGPSSFRVRTGAGTEHDVTVPADLLAELGAVDDERLVRESFVFLLEREPREAILRSFDLPVIGRYFPGYEGAIARYLQDHEAPPA